MSKYSKFYVAGAGAIFELIFYLSGIDILALGLSPEVFVAIATAFFVYLVPNRP